MQKVSTRKSRLMRKVARNNIDYYLLMAIPLMLIFVFSYIPMFGIIISFQDYAPGRPFWGDGSVWVGLRWFKDFMASYYFLRIIKNTLVINILQLFMGFWIPIAFAITVNEVKNSKFRKFTQTVSYLPNFISTVVVAGMVLSFIASDGIITNFLYSIGIEAKSLNTNAAFFPWLYTFTTVWKTFGWKSILYLSTITAIDPGMYEAAEVDGATRLKKIWYITLPCLLPLIMIQLIFAIGGMLASNTDMILLLYNSSVYTTADVIGTFVYRENLMGGHYSYGTASGLLMGLFSFALVYGANTLSRKTTDYSLW